VDVRLAIQGVCAWPNLQRLADGTILAAIFNQPCHGLREGDLDCWASQDEGKTWRFRGRIAEHEPGTARMNCAAGVLANGEPMVLCSGWSDRGPRYEHRGFERARVLRAWVCRSSGGGRSWKISREFPAPPDTALGRDNNLVPFGNLQVADDGSVCGAAYLRRDLRRASYVVRSRDNGASWNDVRPLNPSGNETTCCTWEVGAGSRRHASSRARTPRMCTWSCSRQPTTRGRGSARCR
jgi:hypothetical protein